MGLNQCLATPSKTSAKIDWIGPGIYAESGPENGAVLSSAWQPGTGKSQLGAALGTGVSTAFLVCRKPSVYGEDS